MRRMRQLTLHWNGLDAVKRAVERLGEMHPGAPVLLCGERGTGRQTVARYIHDGSIRREHPFVAVNLGIAPNMVESELFGPTRGVPPEPRAPPSGRFAQAHGGTLYLDEISEAPPAVQEKLLRVLRDQRLEPRGVGEFDVRVIAADRELAPKIAVGHFQKDLWELLSVAIIQICPLRERGASAIQALAIDYTKRLCAEFRKKKQLDDEALSTSCAGIRGLATSVSCKTLSGVRSSPPLRIRSEPEIFGHGADEPVAPSLHGAGGKRQNPAV